MTTYKFLAVSAIFTLVSTGLYNFIPKARRYLLLLALSFCAIIALSGFGSIYILITSITTYAAGIFIDKLGARVKASQLPKEEKKKLKAKIKNQKKLVILFYVIINLGILAIIKYFNLFSLSAVSFLNLFNLELNAPTINVLMPLGISYYTLIALSYVIDVFRGKFKAEKNPLKVALFVMFFPQLQEGPFNRFDELSNQINAADDVSLKSLYAGGARILWGLFKIFMIANRASIISDAIFTSYKSYGSFTVILAAIAFIIQLYAEFSGYIDIAHGMSNIFNIKLCENFDMPFISQSVAEFWRRWHISLGSFFRDYVFYPVSTSKALRKLTKPLSFNLANNITLVISLLAVWFLTGLWHGASWKYVFYGLYYFVIIVSSALTENIREKFYAKLKINPQANFLKCFRIIRTFLLILIGMLMFRAPDMNTFFFMMSSLIRVGEPFHILAAIDGYDLLVLIICVLILIASAILKLKGINLQKKFDALENYQKYLYCLFLFFVIVIFGAYGFAYLPPDPIYGGF